MALSDNVVRHLAQLGAEAELVPAGVDLARFRPPTPEERAQQRAELGIAASEQLVVARPARAGARRAAARARSGGAPAGGAPRLDGRGRIGRAPPAGARRPGSARPALERARIGIDDRIQREGREVGCGARAGPSKPGRIPAQIVHQALRETYTLEDLARPARGVERHHGSAAGERLEQHVGQALGARREHEEVGVREPDGHVGAVAGEVHAGVEAELAAQRAELTRGRVPPAGSSPRIQSSAPGSRARSAAKARIRRSKPFWSTSRPTPRTWGPLPAPASGLLAAAASARRPALSTGLKIVAMCRGGTPRRSRSRPMAPHWTTTRSARGYSSRCSQEKPRGSAGPRRPRPP